MKNITGFGTVTKLVMWCIVTIVVMFIIWRAGWLSYPEAENKVDRFVEACLALDQYTEAECIEMAR